MIQVITGWDKVLDWEFLCNDFTQEEMRLNLVKGTTRNSGKGSKVEKEEERRSLL